MTQVTRAPPLSNFAIVPPAPKSGSSGCADTTSTSLNFGDLEFDEVLRAGFLVVVFLVATSLTLSDRGNRLFHQRLGLAGAPSEESGIAGWIGFHRASRCAGTSRAGDAITRPPTARVLTAGPRPIRAAR